LASRALPPAGLLNITPSFIFNRLGPILSAPISAAHLLDRRPAAHLDLRADRTGDACVE
jgi:hypothetical protein